MKGTGSVRVYEDKKQRKAPGKIQLDLEGKKKMKEDGRESRGETSGKRDSLGKMNGK